MHAFMRFIGAQNTPVKMFRDNGTNVIGAKQFLGKELKEAIEQTEEKAKSEIANDGINWKFISPNSPHFIGHFMGSWGKVYGNSSTKASTWRNFEFRRVADGTVPNCITASVSND